jgi:putative ABC transport system permease protein
MFWNILGRDLRRRKTMNLILFLFIVLAATFLASSISNMITLSGAVDHFFSVSQVPDLLVMQMSDIPASDLTKGTVNTFSDDQETSEQPDPLMTYLQDSPLVTEMQVMDFLAPGRETVHLAPGSSGDEEALTSSVDTLLLGTPSHQFIKVFDQEDQPLSLSQGEIAIPRKESVRTSLQIGDKLIFHIGGIDREFTIAALTKDAAFGSVYVSMVMYYLSSEDYMSLASTGDTAGYRLYLADSPQIDTLMTQLRKQRLLSGTVLEESTFHMSYFLDLLVAGLLTLVSICLILFAFLILHFTILMTLQEDYKEIGIMKAIGMKDSGIRRIYLVKYLGLSALGSVLGLLLSFPIGGRLLQASLVNMVSSKVGIGSIFYHVLSAFFVAALVLFFCFESFGKLRRITVIDAIRSGSNGERFKAKSFLSLHSRRHMSIPFYLACNDILCNLKRFIVLTLVYMIGILMLLLPLYALRTLQSDDIIRNFSMRKVTGFMDNGVQYLTNKDDALMLADMAAIKENLKNHGLDCNVYGEGIYTVTAYFDDPDELYSCFAWQSIGFDGTDYSLTEGRFPQFDNEVMLTNVTAKQLGVVVGDRITLILSQGERSFVVTGLYQSLDNLGEGMRFSTKTALDRQALVSLVPICVDILTDMDQESALGKVKELYPSYTIQSTSDYLNHFMGGTLDQMSLLVLLVFLLVSAIVVLVTVLMGNAFLCREHGDIAILKCLGFTDFSLKLWQTCRVLVIMLAAAILGCVLSVVLLPITIEPIFAMMGGTKIQIVIHPLEFFVCCPLFLLVISILCEYVTVGEIKKIACAEINSAE